MLVGQPPGQEAFRGHRFIVGAGADDLRPGGSPHLHQGDGEPRPDPAGPFWAAADRAQRSPAWRYREVATGHMVAVNRPRELARILLELA